ncbi:MAG: signal peptidase II [Syntrophorhabdus sp.]
MRRYSVLALIPVIFILDRITKYWIMQNLPIMGEIKMNCFFSIVHVRNFGGVFGVLNQSGYAKYIFILVPVLVAAALVFIIFKYAMSQPKMLALTLVLSGALGNIYDRIFYGSVVDFLDFFYGSHHWPAFNVADIAVSIGIGLIILLELMAGKKQAS